MDGFIRALQPEAERRPQMPTGERRGEALPLHPVSPPSLRSAPNAHTLLTLSAGEIEQHPRKAAERSFSSHGNAMPEPAPLITINGYKQTQYLFIKLLSTSSKSILKSELYKAELLHQVNIKCLYL